MNMFSFSRQRTGLELTNGTQGEISPGRDIDPVTDNQFQEVPTRNLWPDKISVESLPAEDTTLSFKYCKFRFQSGDSIEQGHF